MVKIGSTDEKDAEGWGGCPQGGVAVFRGTGFQPLAAVLRGALFRSTETMGWKPMPRKMATPPKVFAR
jgi:hypothetical protein